MKPSHIVAVMKRAADKIASFLVSQGGMKNGYLTFADGVVRKGSSGKLTILLGDDSPAGKKRAASLASTLECELHEAIGDPFLDRDFVIRIDAKDDGAGSYSMRLSVADSIGVDLYNAEIEDAHVITARALAKLTDAEKAVLGFAPEGEEV